VYPGLILQEMLDDLHCLSDDNNNNNNSFRANNYSFISAGITACTDENKILHE